MNAALQPYIPMVDFLADYFGDYAEVVLHDLTSLEQSIIKKRPYQWPQRGRSLYRFCAENSQAVTLRYAIRRKLQQHQSSWNSNEERVILYPG